MSFPPDLLAFYDDFMVFREQICGLRAELFRNRTLNILPGTSSGLNFDY